MPTGEVPGPALSGAAEPPFADVSGMAPLGEGVAVLNAAPEPFQRGETALRLADVALRLQDGTWAELPDAPPLWNPSVAAVGETIALLGLECDSDRCLNLVPKGFLLSSDLQSWNPLDLGGASVQASADTGFSEIGNGVVQASASFYAIDPSGSVAVFPAQGTDVGSTTSTLTCVNDVRQLVYVEMKYGDDPVRQITEATDFEETPATPPVPTFEVREAELTAVRVADLTAPTITWVDSDLPPVRSLTDPLTVCGPDGPILAVPGAEYAWDGGTWTERAVELPSGLSDGDARRFSAGSLLTTGTVVIEVPGGFDPSAKSFVPLANPVYVRTQDGQYEHRGETAGLQVAGARAYEVPNGSADAIREFEL